MDSNIKQQWVEALRSGKYAQGAGQLRSENNEFCCLGVLCDLAPGVMWAGTLTSARNRATTVGDVRGTSAFLPMGLGRELGLSADIEDVLASMNDAGRSFSEIADYIEEHL